MRVFVEGSSNRGKYRSAIVGRIPLPAVATDTALATGFVTFVATAAAAFRAEDVDALATVPISLRSASCSSRLFSRARTSARASSSTSSNTSCLTALME